MMNCWQAEMSNRPTFADLHTSLDILLTNVHSKNYIDLIVDKTLPYYDMSTVQEDEEELDSNDLKLNDGYPEAAGLRHTNLQGTQRQDSNSSRLNIPSRDISMQTVNESECTSISTDDCKQEEEQAPTDTNPDETKELPADTNPDETKELPTDTNPDETKELPTDTNPDEPKELPADTNPDEIKELK